MPLEDVDLFGAEDAAARLARRLDALQPTRVVRAADGRPRLSPPLSPARDHIAGPVSARTTLVVFGAFGTPASRHLGRTIERIRERHMATTRIAWRHDPDAVAHPRAIMLALAAEAAAAHGHFWALTRELLRLRHDDPQDLHAAMLRAGLDPERTIEAMRAGTGEDRIAENVASALASGVAFSPALFIDDERYEGPLDEATVSATVDDLVSRTSAIRATPGSHDQRV
jgi:NhaA family Na+:H+ antiporter